MKTIQINLFDRASITKACRQYEEWRKQLEEKITEFIRALGERGVQTASARFSEAVYDGTNDVSVSMEQQDDKTVAVVATGDATLFIEFGSGIIYPDIHPEAAGLGMRRGEYGYGFGNNIWGWTYEGEPGSNGTVIYTGRKAGKVHTFGNPANMCMYHTVRELEEICKEVAKEVFS